jgi:hypothetical protein
MAQERLVFWSITEMPLSHATRYIAVEEHSLSVSNRGLLALLVDTRQHRRVSTIACGREGKHDRRKAETKIQSTYACAAASPRNLHRNLMFDRALDNRYR